MKKVLFIIFLIVIIDFISKQIVLHNLSNSIVIIPHFFSLSFVKNTGVAFGLLDGKKMGIILGTIFLIFFLFLLMKREKIGSKNSIFYAIIIGGAIGNFIDRIVYGYVIDFLDFNIFGYDFPVFNLADSAIVIGVLLMLIMSFCEGGDR